MEDATCLQCERAEEKPVQVWWNNVYSAIVDRNWEIFKKEVKSPHSWRDQQTAIRMWNVHEPAATKLCQDHFWQRSPKGGHWIMLR